MDSSPDGDVTLKKSVHGKGPVKDKNGFYTCDDAKCIESFKRKCEWK